MDCQFAESSYASARRLPRISTIYVRALLEAVDTAGTPIEDFVRDAGVSSDEFATPYGWVESHELDRLIRHALELTGDPAFGLHWAEQSPMMKFDLLTMITAHAPTLREALASVLKFQPIVYESPELEVVERADSVLLRLAPLATNELALRVRTELGICSLVRLMRHVHAPDAAIRRIAFAHRAPAYAPEYSRLFGARVRFDQAHSGVEIDPAWLDRQLHSANVELYQILTIQGQQVLARVQSSAGYAGQVRAYLRRLFPRLPEMRDTARALGLSERSLRRRLDEEGWSYSAILQESQQLLAQQLLGDPTRSVQEVGYDVGFKSTAAFHRAFKRWTGESPVMFRNAKLHP